MAQSLIYRLFIQYLVQKIDAYILFRFPAEMHRLLSKDMPNPFLGALCLKIGVEDHVSFTTSKNANPKSHSLKRSNPVLKMTRATP